MIRELQKQGVRPFLVLQKQWLINGQEIGENKLGNKLYEFFHPEDKLKDIRLSGSSPCVDCVNVHRYNRGTALEEEIVDKEKCNYCIEKLNYDLNCIVKLAWYENNDERLRDVPRKEGLYDRGVECPETERNGRPVLYPWGWA